MTFSEGVKFPKGWRVKLDPEALNMTSNSKGTNIVFSTKPLKGRQFHFIQLHIEVLTQQNTLRKNHNKAGSGGAEHDAKLQKHKHCFSSQSL
ncbi:hypothetical protein HCA64_02230 [Listeria booriae]|uniref:Uncharacterized protein n=1 Tax=Listeria booriae TaxID=1552123 RepID=A0A099W6S6_9LIST|nr:hypothetical protein [Listeria booriae]KGL40697.1 hypothetical protein EP57_09070 [Listeria booriae]MBC1905286.1 hypothetical protein [Listeria booriae]